MLLGASGEVPDHRSRPPVTATPRSSPAEGACWESMTVTELGERLVEALRSGDDRALRAHLLSASGLPGPRLNLRLVGEFAAAVGALIQRPDTPVARLEALLDGWSGLGTREAPVVQPEVILPCAAVAAYGEAARVRPEWWADEMAKLRRAAGDPRWRVREVVAGALQRVLDVD